METQLAPTEDIRINDVPRLAAPTDPATATLAMLAKAIDAGMDPDKLGKLIDLQEKLLAMRAAQEFADALTAFQAKAPQVFKWRKAQGGANFRFASLDDVKAAVGKLQAECGIVDTYTTKRLGEGLFEIICRVRVGTHCEETAVSLRIPAPIISKSSGAAVINDAQLDGQGLSYGRRYAYCAALGIVLTDQEDDRDGADLIGAISAEEAREVERLIVDRKADLDRFLAWCAQCGHKIATVAEMPKTFLPKALDALNRKGGAK